MTDDAVPIPPAAARAFLQLSRHARAHLIEERPARPHQRRSRSNSSPDMPCLSMLENANEMPQMSVEPVPGYCSTTRMFLMESNSAFILASFGTWNIVEYRNVAFRLHPPRSLPRAQGRANQVLPPPPSCLSGRFPASLEYVLPRFLDHNSSYHYRDLPHLNREKEDQLPCRCRLTN